MGQNQIENDPAVNTSYGNPPAEIDFSFCPSNKLFLLFLRLGNPIRVNYL